MGAALLAADTLTILQKFIFSASAVTGAVRHKRSIAAAAAIVRVDRAVSVVVEHVENRAACDLIAGAVGCVA